MPDALARSERAIVGPTLVALEVNKVAASPINGETRSHLVCIQTVVGKAGGFHEIHGSHLA